MSILCYIDAKESDAIREKARSIGLNVVDETIFAACLEALHSDDRFMYTMQMFDGGKFVRLGGSKRHLSNLAAWVKHDIEAGAPIS